METSVIIAIIEGIALCILFVLIFFRKIGRPLTETEIQMREQKKADKRREKREEEIEKYEKLQELERIAKSLVSPITIMSYDFDSMYIYHAHLRDSKGVMLNVENIGFDMYKVNPCPTVHALVRSCVNKKNGDTIN